MAKLSDSRGGFIYAFDPDDVVLITDPGHPRYDPRVERDLTDEFVANIDAHGILKPILVHKDDDGEPEALDGRRRLRAARAANKVRRRDGRPILMVPCVYKRIKDDAEAATIRTAANLHEGDPISFRAERAAEYIEKFKWTTAATAQVFGVGEQSIKQWLALLDCAASVWSAVDAGKLTLAAATKLSRLSRAEQAEELEKVKEGKPSKAASGSSGLGRKARPGLSRERMRKFYEVAKDVGDDALDSGIALTKYFLGDIQPETLLRSYPGLRPAVDAAGEV